MGPWGCLVGQPSIINELQANDETWETTVEVNEPLHAHICIPLHASQYTCIYLTYTHA